MATFDQFTNPRTGSHTAKSARRAGVPNHHMSSGEALMVSADTAPVSAPSVLVAMGDLLSSRPGPAAPPDVVADWFDRKADLMDAIAAHRFTSPTEAANAAECATAARVHAHELRQGGDL